MREKTLNRLRGPIEVIQYSPRRKKQKKTEGRKLSKRLNKKNFQNQRTQDCNLKGSSCTTTLNKKVYSKTCHSEILKHQRKREDP